MHKPFRPPLTAVERNQDRDAAQQGMPAKRGRRNNSSRMLTRSMTTSMSGRAAAARRLRRRTVSATGRMYCSTNGCTTFMVVETDASVARCPVCGAVRHLRPA